ncbi:MAG: broad specificity phosphatase PhoE [Halioglobus sp.]|jgi:broad specificity phosphatase PhoE
MDIYLVRHGEAAASWGESPDPGLSELGVEQAEAVGRTLAEQLSGSTQLVSSPLARAQETALPLARVLEKSVGISDIFREVPSPVPLEQRQDWLRQFMAQQWDEQGEDLIGWRDATSQGLLAFTQPTVVFTHFLVINAVVGQLLGKPETLCCWPDNGSITHLRKTPDGLELVALGKQIKTHVN